MLIEELRSGNRVAFRQASYCIRIVNPAQRTAEEGHAELDRKDVRTLRPEAVDVGLERRMKNDIARLDPVKTGVSRFDVAAFEHYRGERHAMSVPLQDFARGMAKAAGAPCRTLTWAAASGL